MKGKRKIDKNNALKNELIKEVISEKENNERKNLISEIINEKDFSKRNISKFDSESEKVDFSFPDLKIDNYEKFKEYICKLQEGIEINSMNNSKGSFSDISNSVKRSIERNRGYYGFVFYIWNPRNLNIKIIPLYSNYPILDMKRMREIYFLTKPSIFLDGIPIYVIIKGIPFTFELQLIESKEQLEQIIELKIPSASEVRAILKSNFTVFLFGKPIISLTFLLFFVSVFIVGQLIQYIVWMNII